MIDKFWLAELAFSNSYESYNWALVIEYIHCFIENRILSFIKGVPGVLGAHVRIK